MSDIAESEPPLTEGFSIKDTRRGGQTNFITRKGHKGRKYWATATEAEAWVEAIGSQMLKTGRWSKLTIINPDGSEHRSFQAEGSGDE